MWLRRLSLLLLLVGLCPQAPAEESPLKQVFGQPTDDALLQFFRTRSRLEIDPPIVEKALRSKATAELVGIGPLAVPALRRASNDLDNPDLAEYARQCLGFIVQENGRPETSVTLEALRVLAERK